MSLVRNLHVLLAYITIIGFVMRAVLALMDSAALSNKALKILPHVIDTLLLMCGALLVLNLGHAFTESWLLAKFIALLAYIGFGVLTLRASSTPMRVVGVIGALASVGYIFAVAMSRNPLLF